MNRQHHGMDWIDTTCRPPIWGCSTVTISCKGATWSMIVYLAPTVIDQGTRRRSSRRRLDS